MKEKKAYVKPEITKVELRPEEAVLTGCKNSTSGPRGTCKTGGSQCGKQLGS